MNGEFHSGAHTVEGGLRRWSAYSLQWPTPMLTARSVAAARGLQLSESEPGVAARTALQGLDSIWGSSDLLAHRPLIMLLDEMGRPRGGGPAADGLPLTDSGTSCASWATTPRPPSAGSTGPNCEGSS